MVAKQTNITISPTVVSPCSCRMMPTVKIASTVMVVEARVITVTSAHHDKHRHLHREQLVGDVAQALNLGVDAHETLHQRDIAERIGGARGKVAVMRLDLALHAVGLAHHQRGQHGEHHAQHEQQDRQPPVDVERQRQQHHQRHDRGKMLAEESEPEPPQRVGAVQHHLHQPAGMGAGVEGQRQLHDVFEIIGQHRLALAMRQLVGVERDRGAAQDGEQAERHPGRQQRPGRRRGQRAGCRLAGQHVDDLAEQHRFGELRAGQQQIGAGQNPAQPRLLAEQFEDAGVKAQHGQAGRIRGDSGDRSDRILIRDRGQGPASAGFLLN